jgi:acyl-CoA synthetase (AMP-forming)/AMP-acid ligase II
MELDWLFEKLSNGGDKAAFVWHGQPYSYRWLLDRTAYWQGEFSDRNLPTGQVVAVESDHSPDATALLLALIQHAAIIVPFSAGIGSNTETLESTAEVRILFRQRPDNRWEIDWRDRFSANDLVKSLQTRGRPGLVLFSSGTTGASKAALHDFGRLLTKFKATRRGCRTLAFLLFDHIGGLNTLFHVLANSGTVIVPDGRDPSTVCATISRHEVELLPTSPTFLNLLLISEAYKDHDLSSLRRVTYGTEPMMQATLDRLIRILPQVEFTQTYGLSELGILRSKSKASGSLLMRVGGEGYETKIVDGILWVRAESAMEGYLNAPNPFDADGWFNTGDEARVEGEFLRILGRRGDVINVGGEKVFPLEVEDVIQTLPNIAGVTVRAELNPITGETVVADVSLREPEDLIALRNRVREACRQRLSPAKTPTRVRVVTSHGESPRFKKNRNNAITAEAALGAD